MSQQRFLNLAWIDIRATADDEIPGTILEGQEAGCIDGAEIAGMQPSSGQRFCGRVWIAPIALHHGRTAHQHFADFSRWQCTIELIANLYVDPGLCDPDRADARVIVAGDRFGKRQAIHRRDRHRRLALPVNLRKTRPKRSERRLAVFDIHWAATVHDALESLESCIAK